MVRIDFQASFAARSRSLTDAEDNNILSMASDMAKTRSGRNSSGIGHLLRST
jgi:hypothetical protein